MRWGLVLGGGGVVGVAWEAGVVATLTDAGIDLRRADVVVGTSAGAVIGSLLRHGRSVDEIVEHARGERALDLDAGAQAAPPVAGDPAAVREVFLRWMAMDPVDEAGCAEVGAHAARCPTMAEPAWVDLFRAQMPDAWPAGDLRVTAVSITTGRRRLFTGADGVPLHLAIAASCSVPGLFPPVSVDGDRYTDGGVWSGTHADVVSDEVDAVLVIAPMGGDQGVSAVAQRSLDREVAALRTAGLDVVAIQPREPFGGAVLMDPTQRDAALATGRADAAAQAGAVAALLGDRVASTRT